MIVAGIDWSLNSPGICILNSTKPDQRTFFGRIESPKKCIGTFKQGLDNIFIDKTEPWGSEEHRHDMLSSWAVSLLVQHQVEQVAIEGYAMGASGRVFNIAESTGLLKHKLYRIRMHVSIFSPSDVKKRFSGKGNAKKDAMAKSFKEKTGYNMHELFGYDKADSTPGSDLVDAYALSTMIS